MERTEWEKKLTSDPAPGRGFTEDHKRAVLARVRESKRPGRLRLLPWAGGFAAMVVAALLVMSPWSGPGTITDTTTSQTLQQMSEVPAGMTVEQIAIESMDRGALEYYGVPLVIDPNAYKTHPAKRGDAVVVNWRDQVQTDRTYHVVLRVVGLPGERLKIADGQVYIDGKKLSTFYGREFHSGLLVEDSEVQRAEVQIPEGQYVLLPDNWWRFPIPERTFPLGEIVGKVIGYKPQ